jgi:hypothetical protein
MKLKDRVEIFTGRNEHGVRGVSAAIRAPDGATSFADRGGIPN